MVCFTIELEGSLLVLSDPKLNLISEASLCVTSLVVDGKENMRAGPDFAAPKEYLGISSSG